MRPEHAAAGVSAILALTGCGTLLGLDDFKEGPAGAAGAANGSSASSGGAGDGGGGSGAAGGAAGSGGDLPTTKVAGTDVPIFVVPGNETSKAVDLSTDHFIAALAPDGASYQTLVGAGLSNGSFSIEKVPRGHYFLNIDKSYYWLDTGGPAPELGAFLPGRATQTLATASTVVTFDVGGMDPWEAQDDIQFISFQANAYSGIQFAEFGNLPVPGDTTFAADTDWRFNFFPPTLLALADTFWLIQLKHQVTTGGLDYAAAVRAASISGVAMQDAQPITLAGTFDSMPTTQTAKVKLSATAYEALGAAIHPKAMSAVRFYGVDVLPAAPDHGFYLGTVDLVVLHPPLGADIANEVVQFGNPFPASFTLACVVVYDFAVPFQLMGANPLQANATVRYADTLGACSATQVGVHLSPAKSIQIDGKSAWDDQTLSSATPTLSWEAPDVGTVRQYNVFVNRLYATNGNTKRENVARLVTDATSVTLPPGIMKSGEKYYVALQAFSSAAPGYAAFPNRSVLPQAETTAMTGILSVP